MKDEDLHPSNLPHQRDIIKWAAAGGQRAIFASFGLMKTQIQLELSKLCLIAYPGEKALIICPLGVKQEFKNDADRLGLKITYVRNQGEVEAADGILITNYERVRDGDINPDSFQCVSLDEASVLRSFGSKTYQEFLNKFRYVPFKWVCTATPSPNRYKELIHYAGFLGIMDTGQALTRFFKRDSTKANNLTLYPHKEREFWLWMSGWALFITKPSDLGYSDQGFDLPDIDIYWHSVTVAPTEDIADRDGNLQMFRNVASSLSVAAKEKRDSLPARLAKAAELINTEDMKHWLLWHHLEREREAIEHTWPKEVCRTVYGSQDNELKEELLIGFARGQYRILATKPEIAGQGCNFQKHCHSAIFLGIDYKFNDFIQAIYRIQRFGQTKRCEVHIIYTEAEESIRKELEAKWKRHTELVQEMVSIIKAYGLSHADHLGELKRSLGVERREVKGQAFTAVNNDCVEEISRLESNRFGMILTSIPFSNHYEYTPSYNDFGHTNSDEHFFAQMDYLTPELLRVLMPGRMAVVHVKDRILFGNVTGTGFPTVNPFHAKTIFHYMSHGFQYCGMITVETDVVRENGQTYRLGWTENCKDGSKMGVGSPEYLLLFRKLPTDTSKGYADTPVRKSKKDYSRGKWQIDARAKWNSSGNRLLGPDDIRNLTVEQIGRIFSFQMADQVYNFQEHVRTAELMEEAGKLPASFETLRVPARTEEVWDDVVRMRTLNSNQTKAKEENHICPFQIDIVERAINRWSNPGDEILDPFGGLMTVPHIAILNKRSGYGVELNPEYFRCGVGYCKEAEIKANTPTLFDLLEKTA